MAEQQAKRVHLFTMNDPEPIFASPTETYNKNLSCFKCGDESLYHDSFAWYNYDQDDLICESCHGKNAEEKRATYEKVITFH